jgi:hypothetical protein
MGVPMWECGADSLVKHLSRFHFLTVIRFLRANKNKQTNKQTTQKLKTKTKKPKNRTKDFRFAKNTQTTRHNKNKQQTETQARSFAPNQFDRSVGHLTAMREIVNCGMYALDNVLFFPDYRRA